MLSSLYPSFKKTGFYAAGCLINDSETHEDYAVFSEDIIFNSTTNQESVEFLSEQLFVAVENLNNFGRTQVKEAELVTSIINFCTSQPVSEQWNTLAEITRRNSKALMVVSQRVGRVSRLEATGEPVRVVGYSGKEHSEWFFNLPQLLADAALKNSEELEWVDKKLRSQALLLIAAR